MECESLRRTYFPDINWKTIDGWKQIRKTGNIKKSDVVFTSEKDMKKIYKLSGIRQSEDRAGFSCK
jgi:hypothetical protein